MSEKINIYYQKYSVTNDKKSTKLQHSIGRELLRYGLLENYGIVFTEDMIQFLERGKPILRKLPNSPEIHFNISHCKGLVVCGITSIAPIGIDVEGERKVSSALIKKVCSPEEISNFSDHISMEEFLNLWTLKESYIKMTGDGLKIPLNTVSFQISKDGIRSNQQGVFWQTTLQNQYIISLSCQKSFPKPVLIEHMENTNNKNKEILHKKQLFYKSYYKTHKNFS